MRISIVGNSDIVLNVFSHSVVAGNTYLGQAVIDVQKHPELYTGIVHRFL